MVVLYYYIIVVVVDVVVSSVIDSWSWSRSRSTLHSMDKTIECRVPPSPEIAITRRTGVIDTVGRSRRSDRTISPFPIQAIWHRVQ